MPYIGKSPVSGGFHKLGNLTASATATYALTLGGAAYFPESANHLIVSLNGVIQACQDSFTVSGSNLVFAEALTTNDTIDFIVALDNRHLPRRINFHASRVLLNIPDIITKPRER